MYTHNVHNINCYLEASPRTQNEFYIKRTQMNFTLNSTPSSSLSPEKNKNIRIDVRCVCASTLGQLRLYLYYNTLYDLSSANSTQSCPGTRLIMYINHKKRIYSYLIDEYKFTCQIFK